MFILKALKSRSVLRRAKTADLIAFHAFILCLRLVNLLFLSLPIRAASFLQWVAIDRVCDLLSELFTLVIIIIIILDFRVTRLRCSTLCTLFLRLVIFELSKQIEVLRFNLAILAYLLGQLWLVILRFRGILCLCVFRRYLGLRCSLFLLVLQLVFLFPLAFASLVFRFSLYLRLRIISRFFVFATCSIVSRFLFLLCWLFCGLRLCSLRGLRWLDRIEALYGADAVFLADFCLLLSCLRLCFSFLIIIRQWGAADRRAKLPLNRQLHFSRLLTALLHNLFLLLLRHRHTHLLLRLHQFTHSLTHLIITLFLLANNRILRTLHFSSLTMIWLHGKHCHMHHIGQVGLDLAFIDINYLKAVLD